MIRLGVTSEDVRASETAIGNVDMKGSAGFVSNAN